MLEDCAPGFEVRLARHSRVIHYKEKVYRAFPKHEDVFLFEVRKLVRSVDIDKDSANKHFSGLFSVA